MSHIVVLGAGTGGITAAFELRKYLKKKHQITVVHERDYFQFVPSNPWVAIGKRKRSQTTLSLARVLGKRGINVIVQPATRIDADGNALELRDGSRVAYDYLLITTGSELAFDAVPGAGPDKYTQSITLVEHAEQAKAAYERFLEAPGPVVVGALPGASCFGVVYEYAFILSNDLRKRKLRKKVPMTFVTPEPYIGHMGIDGLANSNGLLQSRLREHDMKWITNAKLTRIEPGRMFVSEMNRHGQLEEEHELPFAYSMLLPAFRGVKAVARTEGLCNANGFVRVDEHQRSLKWPNIFAAGVGIDIPALPTPVPVGMPKTGFMIETMVTAAVHNIQADLTGRKATARATWSTLCLADLGDTGALFVGLPQIPPRNTTWARMGWWARWGKIVFERYFLTKMRWGTSEPLFEKYMFKALGISRLEKK
ncbi:MAG: FAD-dependent oxidoreductase [Cystobacterineae bacterium]|nr:FAD-dependent oxidoreductase [Cystobacterineae bacterium]